MTWALVVVGLFFLAWALREMHRLRHGGVKAPHGPGRMVEKLTDARDAAAILLVQIGVYSPHMGVAHKQKIVELMTDEFDCTESEAEGLYSFGRMAIGHLGDAGQSLNEILRPIRDQLTLDEMKRLVEMMDAVATVDGMERRADANRLIARTAEQLKIPTIPVA